MKPFLFFTVAVVVQAQTNQPLAVGQFATLARSCAPHIGLRTALAIARAESALRPYAVSLNYPEESAVTHGFSSGTLALAKQPESKAQALRWTSWLLAHGYTVSIGLMQINTQQAHQLGFTVPDLFDPCTNISASSRILRKAYVNERTHPDALDRSLSIYNSGRPHTATSHGMPYAERVRSLALPK